MAYNVAAIILIVLTLVAWAMADRRARVLPRLIPRRTARFLFAVFFLGMALYPLVPLSRSIRGTEPAGLPAIWATAAYLWLPIVLPATVAIWISLRAIRRGYAWAFGKKRDGRFHRDSIVGKDVAPGSAPMLSRRQAFQLAGAALPPFICGGVTAAAIAQRGNFRIRRVHLSIASLPPDLDGITLCQISDLHAGNFFPTHGIARIADAANALKTDLVVFTGDLIDRGLLDRIPDGLQLIDHLDRRHGFAMIEGNHDVQHGAHLFQRAMRERNLPFLLDGQLECRIPGRDTPVQFLGITWGDKNLDLDTPTTADPLAPPRMKGTAASVQRVAALRRADAFPILLAHHPHACDPAVEASLPLTLAGHAHGG